jgi:NADPH:quinone reductase-like Zn-dependent oxidoreductase
MFWELQHEPPCVALTELAALMAAGKLKPVIERRAPVSDIAEVAQALMARKFVGKAVLSF